MREREKTNHQFTNFYSLSLEGEEGVPLGEKTYSTDFSSTKSDGGGSGGDGHRSPVPNTSNGSHTPRGENIRISSTYTQGLQAATPRSHLGGGARSSTPVQHNGGGGGDLNRSLPSMPSTLQVSDFHIHRCYLVPWLIHGRISLKDIFFFFFFFNPFQDSNLD